MSKLEVDAIEPQSGTTITIGSSGDTVNLVGTLNSNGSPLPGDISSVVAGTGLSGGGTTGAVTLNIEAAQPTITSLGTITGFTSTGIDDNADATAITIDSSEQIGIGTSSMDGKLHVMRSDAGATGKSGSVIVAENQGNCFVSLLGLNSDNCTIFFGDNNNDNAGQLDYDHANDSMSFFTNQSERMRITSAGLVGIGTSSPTSLLSLEANSPDIMFTDTSGGTDSKKWRVFGLDSDFRIGCRNDANSSGQTAYEIIRSSATIDSHRFSTGGSERMRITSAGQLLVGTTDAPSSSDTPLKIHVPITSSGRNALEISQDTTGTDKPGAALGLIVDNSGSSTNAAQLSFSTASGGSLSERMRITSAGLVGIGTSSPTHNLTVDGGTSTSMSLIKDETGSATVRYYNGSSQKAYIQLTSSEDMDFYAASGVDQVFYGNNSEVMRLSTGAVFNENGGDRDFRVESNNISNMFVVDGGTDKIFINTSSSIGSAYLQIQNNYTRTAIDTKSNNTAPHHAITFHNPNGQVGQINTDGSGVTFTSNSDYRLKENVNYDFDATTRLKQLKPARFNFKADTNKIVDGFIAHEVSSVVQEAIHGTKDAVDEDGNPQYQGIDQSKLVPLLVKTIQELEARITTLENA